MKDTPTASYCLRCGATLEERALGDRVRLACPDAACGFVHYDNPAPVVAALVEHEGDVLLVRNKGWPDTWYGLMTGFLEKGEEPEAGLLRELDEELGLTGEVVSLIGVYMFAQMNQLIVAYHVREHGLESGLVDNKICAVDRDWSGLRFVVRSEDRPPR